MQIHGLDHQLGENDFYIGKMKGLSSGNVKRAQAYEVMWNPR